MEYNGVVLRREKMRKYTSAIILAAGVGSRFGGDTKKQYTELCKEPCIVHTIRAFENTECIDEIVLVGESSEIEPLIKNKGFRKIKCIVKGGAERQDSALCGFDAVSDKTDYVVIHDGARCLVTPEIIETVTKEAHKFKAAAAAHKSSDTVKISAPDGFIDHTEDRDKVWLVQTPQAFKEDVYRVAAYMAKRDGAAVTDDCMLLERLGFDVKLCECGRDNIKLTTAEDKIIAEAILESRKATK